MALCINNCGCESVGRSKYCSSACRVAYNRNRKSVTGESVTDVTVASLEHYNECPELYALRSNAEVLNWGEPMDFEELKYSGFIANRVPIFGDWDYE